MVCTDCLYSQTLSVQLWKSVLVAVDIFSVPEQNYLPFRFTQIYTLLGLKGYNKE
ncbi:hypothetical protein BA6E_10115 [Bacteroidales bacterium 6E]|nr:hypothetical protein BA6E_10115 [Bacteroidales bacterium 6E]